jgi:hypothetical protein
MYNAYANPQHFAMYQIVGCVPEAKIWGSCKIFGCDDEMWNFGKLWISCLIKFI